MKLPPTLDEAHEHIRQLRAALVPWSVPRYRALHLSPQKAMLVAMLVEAPGWIPMERILDRMDAHSGVIHDRSHIRVLISRINRVLGVHGIAIQTARGLGYSMSPEDKDRLHALEVQTWKASAFSLPPHREGPRLSRQTAALLRILVEAPGLVTDDQIFDQFDAARGYRGSRNGGLIRVLIHNLRVKLSPHEVFIETFKGHGYAMAKASKERVRALEIGV